MPTAFQLNRSRPSIVQRFSFFFWLKGKDSSAVLLTVAGSVVLSIILVATNGSVALGAAVLAVATVILLTVYRLDWGLFLCIGMALFFDQLDTPTPFSGQITYKVGFFTNLKEISYLPWVNAGVMNPFELLTLLLLSVWLLWVAVKKNMKVNRPSVCFAAIAFFSWLVVSFVYGQRHGGLFLPALWEIRALFYLGLMYIFVPQIVQTKAQLQTLIWVCIIAISCKAFQGILRFIRLGFSFQGVPALTNHEDPLFFGTLFILFLGLVLFGGHAGQRRALSWLMFPLVVGFITAQRRAAYGAMVVSVLTFVVLLPKKERWVLMKIALPMVLVVGVYVALSWDSDGKFASPVRLVKSGFSTEEEVAGDRYYSNLYRELEKYDLAVTVREAPWMGIGFGNRYSTPLPLVAIPFPLRDFIAHNAILWLLVKMGGIGFFLFCLFFDSFVFRGASLFARLRDPYLKAVCAVVLATIVGQIVVSYYDLQLNYYRNMIYLGALMGLLPTLEMVDKQSQVNSTDVLPEEHERLGHPGSWHI
jgi:hypothetical protein